MRPIGDERGPMVVELRPVGVERLLRRTVDRPVVPSFFFVSSSYCFFTGM